MNRAQLEMHRPTPPVRTTCRTAAGAAAAVAHGAAAVAAGGVLAGRAAGLPPRGAAAAAAAAAGAVALAAREGRAPLAPNLSPAGLRLRDSVAHLGWQAAYDRITLFVDAGPSRRQMTLLDTRGCVTESVTRFLEAVAVLLDMVRDGDTAAELILLYLPRVLAAKGLTIVEAWDHFCGGTRPVPRRTELTPAARWVRAVEAATERQGTRALLDRLDTPAHPGVANVEEVLEQLHPPQSCDGEWQRWAAAADAVERVERFSARDLRRWAHACPRSNGGETGWTGSLVRLLRAREGLFDAFAAWAARPPRQWNHIFNASIALRVLTGWLVPRPGKGPRPIAAPSFIRRVGGRALGRRLRRAAERYCARRGHLGLSSEKEQCAYTALANACVKGGGSVGVDDLEASYTHIQRPAVERAVRSFDAEARAAGEGDAADALQVALADFYWADSTGTALHVSRANFRESDTLLDIGGLAQGCTASIWLQELVLAFHTPHLLLPSGPVTLGIHDDSIRMAGATAGLPPLPNVAAFGGRFAPSKSRIVGPAGVAPGHAADPPGAAEQPLLTVYGRPVGRVAAWMADRLDVAKQRMMRIREVAELAPAVAVAALCKLQGPHGLLIHAIKGVPLDDYDPRWLTALEQDWADLVADVLGPREGPWADADWRRQRVFADSSPFAGSKYAAELACLSGLALATEGVERLFGEARAQAVARALAGGYLERHHISVTSAAIRGVADAAWDANLRRKPGPSLWRHALQPRGELGAIVDEGLSAGDAWTPADRDGVARCALAMCVGYPVRVAAGIRRAHCRACDEPVDDAMHHINSCRVSEKARRHNDWNRDLVRIGQAAGNEVTYHDQRLPCLADGSRPVDFAYVMPGQRRIQACDTTMVVPGNLAEAAARKHTAYDGMLEGTPFRCRPIAVGLDGSIHAEAEEVFHRWKSRYARIVRESGYGTGACAANAVSVELGVSFARRCVQAIRRWDERLQRMLRSVEGPTRPRRERERRAQAGAETPARIRAPPVRAARGEVPEMLRRESTRLEARWDLANIPLGGGGPPSAEPPHPAQRSVSPLGQTLRDAEAGDGTDDPMRADHGN